MEHQYCEGMQGKCFEIGTSYLCSITLNNQPEIEGKKDKSRAYEDNNRKPPNCIVTKILRYT